MVMDHMMKLDVEHVCILHESWLNLDVSELMGETAKYIINETNWLFRVCKGLNPTQLYIGIII